MRFPLLTGFTLFAVLGSLFFGHRLGSSRQQPIAFNHSKHLAAGMACTDCHAGAQNEARATLPPLATCLVCHETALTQSPEENKLRTLAAAHQEPAWAPLTRVPSHVYFSHRRHVALAKMECVTCHGAMEKLTAPPRRLFRPLTMSNCIGCHTQKGASTDCNDCHR